jgi:hypothetical protein
MKLCLIIELLGDEIDGGQDKPLMDRFRDKNR